jgi:L-threonylcarbamoyladenylate synthase
LNSSSVNDWPIDRIATILKSGGIIVYPTETIYGLGVDAVNDRAVTRLFQIKLRLPKKPVSILVKDRRMLEWVVSEVPAPAKRIMEQYWPGPVTLILPASDRISPALTGQTGTIGVRISPHPFVRSLFQVFNSPVTSTSANLSGGTSLMDPEDILRTFGGLIDLVIEMPEFMEGGSSTVIDMTGERPRILRKGAVEIEGV